jgi:molybdopterin converting factor subunit 1
VTITLLYFAAVRDLVGRAEEKISLPPEVTTIGTLAAHLSTMIPGLEARLGSVRWAQNETFVDFGALLAEGDVIALIPPVAGG